MSTATGFSLPPPLPPARRPMRTVLVINAKGGCGKTTVSTNLASYYASRGMQVTLMDHDPQGSSINWVRSRPALLPRVHAANAAAPKAGHIRSIDKFVPPTTQVLIVDPPAGTAGLALQDLVRSANFILIPVAPSSIDIHATARFVQELLLSGGVRRLNIKTAVVANRVRSSMPTYEPLERFLRSLNLPLLTRISDADCYLQAAETGVGVFEMPAAAVAAQRREFMPIIDWLNLDPGRNDLNGHNVVPFGGNRKAG